ncbi:MAG: DUF2148 domain-containing protein [Dysgonamonadaceae bacterium]|jgi:uncharacterized ferredoxin-like protein|nr:DUF2148 domain-containing protein [Dysgonamonadaceae bacterium]
MILNERDTRHERLIEAARQMMTAARTAPKAKGLDIIEIIVVEGEDIKTLSDKTYELGEKMGLKFMFRDAKNVLSAEVVVLIGTHSSVQGLNCAHCGFATCAEKPEPVPCAINSIDVGIAVGSACATAADLRVDSRTMFSVGLAAQKLNWLTDCKTVIAIPLSAGSKNPFFDRTDKTVADQPDIN